ncbi:MAG: hypothetical protein WA783_18925 [Phormidesmis sp.]
MALPKGRASERAPEEAPEKKASEKKILEKKILEKKILKRKPSEKEVAVREATLASAFPSAVLKPSSKIDKKNGQVRLFNRLPGQFGRQCRRVGAVVSRHPVLVQIAVLLVLTSGAGCFLLYSLFKGAWSPEKDNLSILSSILKMEIARKSALAIDGNSQQVVTRSYQSLEPYVATEDWVWINRFGSTSTYGKQDGKQDQRLIASCSAYSPLYLVCNLSEIP